MVFPPGTLQNEMRGKIRSENVSFLAQRNDLMKFLLKVLPRTVDNCCEILTVLVHVLRA